MPECKDDLKLVPVRLCIHLMTFDLVDDIPPRDDDVLSLSARSVASSCSLASETLERARNRRDEFWGRPHARPCLG